MPATLESFVKFVQPDVPAAPGLLIEDMVLAACREFCRRTELRSVVQTINLSAGDNQFTVVPPAGSAVVRVRTVMRNGTQLTPVPDVPTYMGLPEYGKEGPPDYFFAFSPDIVTLVPAASADTTLLADVVLQPAASATTVDDELFDSWAEVIASGAKARLLQMADGGWSNPKLAVWHWGRFDAGIATAAAVASKGKVGAPMRVRPMEL